ncbi:MAG: hemolysin family protein [Cyanobacteria bacterium J06627_28]
MIKLVIAFLVVIIGSGLCSGIETALLSIPLLRAQQLAQSKSSPSAIALLNVRKHVSRPIATIVILNNIFNIVGSIAVGAFAEAIFESTGVGIVVALFTFSVILFAEILPKTLGERYAETIGLLVAIPIRGITALFTPLTWLLEQLMAPLTKGSRGPVTNESEIRLLTTLGYQEGLIEDDEAEMIDRVFRLNDLMAADIMTPRVAITFIRGDAILSEVQNEIIGSQHTRILVIEEDLDHVIGVALKAELLGALVQGQANAPIKSLMRQVHYVPDTERTDSLIKTFQALREHLMVVVDEYGGVSGVVTLEDTLEVLTGEIVDETDRNIDLQDLGRVRQKLILQRSGFRKQKKRNNGPQS